MAYQLGGEPARYALEGSVAITGALVQWMRDNFGLIANSAEIEALARTVEDNGGVYFVPLSRACTRRTGSTTPAASSPA